MDNENISEKIIDRKRVFNGLIINVDHMRVELPNGKPAQREVVVHMGAAAIVPVDDDGYTYMVRQYRAPLQEIMLEIPAGKLDCPNENTLAAAKRELSEETGLEARDWTLLCVVATSPGFCTEKIALYLARGLTQKDKHTDADEFLNVIKLPLEAAVEMARRGEMPDAKSVTAILLANECIKCESKGDKRRG